MQRVLLVLVGAACAASQSATVQILKNNFGTWEGWGVSLCWWANVFGGDAALADLVWTRQTNLTVPGVSMPLPALNFNIARYNAGGSSNTSYNGQSIVYSPNIPWWKQIQGFWPGPDFDWTADANQRAALLAAQARATSFVAELFSNSPMWWQLVNQNPSGSNDGSSDNLLPAQYTAHAKYMATVAAHFGTAWGLNFSSIEMFNEPIATWWKADGTQEGCHFDATTQAALLQLLPAQLQAVGLVQAGPDGSGGIRIAASDESWVDQALVSWAVYNASTRSKINQYNVHGYEGGGGDRAALYQQVVVQGGKILRLSEHGDGDGTGASMASSLFADWSVLHPRSWVYWQVADVAGGWGMVQFAVAPPAVLQVNNKHFVMAQFSRHIRPGMLILASTDVRNSTAAAWDASTGLLAVVTSNPSGSRATVTLDLSAFSTVPAGPVAGQWITSMANGSPTPGAAYTPVTGAVVGKNKQLVLQLPANTVTTVEIAGVQP